MEENSVKKIIFASEKIYFCEKRAFLQKKVE